MDLRESYGLPPLPPTVHSYPEAVKECHKLMELTGFRKLLDHAHEVKEERAAKNKEAEEGGE